MLSSSTYDDLINLLETSGAQYRIIRHAAEGRTDIASALRGNSLGQAAKSIIVRVSITKKKGKYLLAVIPGDRCIDLVKLAQLVGGTKAFFAALNVAERLTGSVSGSIPPFAFNHELELIVDNGLLANEEIFFNVARLDCSVALRINDYLTLTRPRLEDITITEIGRIGLRPYCLIN
jgi:Ala-tRNA(Pro) deacylase